MSHSCAVFSLWVVVNIFSRNGFIGEYHAKLQQMFFSGLCPEPGGIYSSTRTKYNGPYNPGDQVTYACNSRGGGTITCQRNGAWTNKPICTGQDCFTCMYMSTVTLFILAEMKQLIYSTDSSFNVAVVTANYNFFSRSAITSPNYNKHHSPTQSLHTPCSHVPRARRCSILHQNCPPWTLHCWDSAHLQVSQWRQCHNHLQKEWSLDPKANLPSGLP